MFKAKFVSGTINNRKDLTRSTAKTKDREGS